MPLMWIIFACVLVSLVRARQVTVVVDDSDPRIAYIDNPPYHWLPFDAHSGLPSSCNCASHGLNVSAVYNGTWHEGSDKVEAKFDFVGTGVDVFSVFRDTLGDLTNITFFLDGQNQGTFTQYGRASGWQYNYHVFTASNLGKGNHELIIQGGSTNMFVLDYITYTQSSRKSIVGPVVGSVIGGIALLFATVFLFWLWGHLRSSQPRAAKNYREAIQINEDTSTTTLTGLVTTKTATIRPVNATALEAANAPKVTITSFKPLTATEDVISSRMTALVARNLKEGVHPFIIPVVGFTYADNKANLISVPVETTELKAYIDRNRPSRDDRMSLVQDMCEGLEHLHKCGIVHSDLKPSNVVVNESDRAMLRGYGAAAIAGRDAGDLYDARYSAPEVLEKTKFTFMSDVFSFACVTLFIMTGEVPYRKLKQDSAVLLAQLDDIPIERDDYRDGLGGSENDRLWELLVRCWNADPQQRPRMSEIARIIFDEGDGVEEEVDDPGLEDDDGSDSD